MSPDGISKSGKSEAVFKLDFYYSRLETEDASLQRFTEDLHVLVIPEFHSFFIYYLNFEVVIILNILKSQRGLHNNCPLQDCNQRSAQATVRGIPLQLVLAVSQSGPSNSDFTIVIGGAERCSFSNMFSSYF